VSGFVFGYGSLAGTFGEGEPARLHGWRRAWGVAMDNTVTIPGYKRYLDPDGRRPAVCVAFLDVREEAGSWVNGVCVPVGPEELAALDERERNYDRVEITGAVPGAPGRTWTYVGREASRERYDTAMDAGRCVVARSYARTVEHGFRALGEWDDFVATTDDERPPLRDLRRVDI
jgi:cation transport regulator ChaC